MSIEKFIAENAFVAEKAPHSLTEVVLASELREFMRRKVVVDADKMTLLLEILYMYEDFDNLGQEAFDHLEAAIDQRQAIQQPTTSEAGE